MFLNGGTKILELCRLIVDPATVLILKPEPVYFDGTEKENKFHG